MDQGVFESRSAPRQPSAHDRDYPTRHVHIPAGYMGDFETLFRRPGYPPMVERPRLQQTAEDDGRYAGGNEIPYVMSKGHLTLGCEHCGDLEGDGDVLGRSFITAFTQASLSRAYMIPELIERWSGHVSIALYIDNIEELPRLTRFLRHLNHTLPDLINPTTQRISISLLFGLEFLLDSTSPIAHRVHPYDAMYPINRLRRLALDASTTNLVLLIDIDVLPSKGAHDLLLTQSVHLRSARKTTLLIPTFELLGEELPAGKLTMRYVRDQCLRGNLIPYRSSPLPTVPFRADPADLVPFCLEGSATGVNFSPHPSQAGVDHGRFLSDNAEDAFEAALAVNAVGYERKARGEGGPAAAYRAVNRRMEGYLFAHRSAFERSVGGAEALDGRLRGHGFNARAAPTVLQALGWRFLVPAKVFLVHRDHDVSQWRAAERGEFAQAIKKAQGRAYDRFLEDVREGLGLG
ncbi:hypothetical protein HK101_008881 [Irineochytrium annulatum]|nr:hypothetical protein HK101_008881 [Irineochytrium annulatum]